MKEKIENLVCWLAFALALQFVLSKGVGLYFDMTVMVNPTANDGSISSLISGLVYEKHFSILLGLLVNMVIAIWLYRNSNTRKFVWALLGIFAKWWALPIFAYYLFLEKSDRENL